MEKEHDDANGWSMEVTCQSLATMFALVNAVRHESDVPLWNGIIPAVDGMIESIVQWEKLEALLESAMKHLPNMVIIFLIFIMTNLN